MSHGEHVTGANLGLEVWQNRGYRYCEVGTHHCPFDLEDESPAGADLDLDLLSSLERVASGQGRLLICISLACDESSSLSSVTNLTKFCMATMSSCEGSETFQAVQPDKSTSRVEKSEG